MATKKASVKKDKVKIKKEKENKMGFFSQIFKSLGTYLTGEVIMETLDDVQDRVEQTTTRVIKTATQWVIFVIGLFFVLWGLGLFLADYFAWFEGLGLVVVGAVLMLLMLLVKAFK